MATTTDLALHELGHALLVEAAREDFNVFARLILEAMFGSGFEMPPVMEILAHRLNELCVPGSHRQTITAPPRHAKSTLISAVWPAFLLGRNPAIEIVCASYVSNLAETLGQLTREIMMSKCYREIFPGTQFVSKTPAADDLLTTANGRRRAVSLGGWLTGVGADVLIIDDPMPAGDAASATAITSAIHWLKTTALNRLNNPARSAVVITQQRIAPNDLIGHVKSSGGWMALDLPAFAEQDAVYDVAHGKALMLKKGDTLWPKRFPMPVLEQLRRDQGEAVFQAQYMQRPYLSQGPIFDLSKFKRFDRGDDKVFYPKKYDGVILSMDPAVALNPGAAETAVTMWGLRNQHLMLLHAVKGHWSQPEQLAYLRKKASMCALMLIETCHSGEALRQWLAEDGITNVQMIYPRGSKEERAQYAATVVSEHFISLPHKASWLEMVEAALTSFPDGGADLVDSITQVLRFIKTPGAVRQWNLDPDPFQPEGKKEADLVYRRHSTYYQRMGGRFPG